MTSIASSYLSKLKSKIALASIAFFLIFLLASIWFDANQPKSLYGVKFAAIELGNTLIIIAIWALHLFIVFRKLNDDYLDLNLSFTDESILVTNKNKRKQVISFNSTAIRKHAGNYIFVENKGKLLAKLPPLDSHNERLIGLNFKNVKQIPYSFIQSVNFLIPYISATLLFAILLSGNYLTAVVLCLASVLLLLCLCIYNSLLFKQIDLPGKRSSVITFVVGALVVIITLLYKLSEFQGISF